MALTKIKLLELHDIAGSTQFFTAVWIEMITDAIAVDYPKAKCCVWVAGHPHPVLETKDVVADMLERMLAK